MSTIRAGNTNTTAVTVTADLTGQLNLESQNGIVNINGTGALDIPSGTTQERPATPAPGMVRYNTTIGGVEFYTSVGWVPYGTLSIGSVTPASFNGLAGTSFSILGTGFSAGTTVQFITNSGTVYSAATTTISNTQSIIATTPVAFTVADEPLDVRVTLSNGLTTTLENAIDCGGTPVWNTPAGSVGVLTESTRSVTNLTGLSATDPDGQAVTYTLISGSLPVGTSINSNTGAFTGSVGAVASETTYTFTVQAADPTGNTSSRQFSITVNPPITLTYTTAGTYTWTAPAGLTAIATLKMIGGGGGGSSGNGQWAAGGGGAGFISATSVPITPGTTYTLVVGAAGAGGTGCGSNGNNGGNTTGFGSTAGGGGGGQQGPVAGTAGTFTLLSGTNSGSSNGTVGNASGGDGSGGGGNNGGGSTYGTGATGVANFNPGNHASGYGNGGGGGHSCQNGHRGGGNGSVGYIQITY